MLTRALIPLAWALWALLVAATLYQLVRAATERAPSPEVSAGLGVVLALVLLAILALAGVAIHVAARRDSTAWQVVLTMLLAGPGFVLVARPLVMAHKARTAGRDAARAGLPDDPAWAALASALVAVRDSNGPADAVGRLLDAGADARGMRMGGGVPPLVYLALAQSPGVHDAMRLLLEHGADPDAADPDGYTPLALVYKDPDAVRLLMAHGADPDHPRPDGLPLVVHFISTQQWESALVLIEHGADLDARNPDGLSVDYYLTAWKSDVFGEHPDGWDRVRSAITQRREAGR